MEARAARCLRRYARGYATDRERRAIRPRSQPRDEEGRGMTETDLVGQATDLLGASFETTASTLTCAVVLLAQHPAIMREMMDELVRVLGGNAPTRDQVPLLFVLGGVIKE